MLDFIAIPMGAVLKFIYNSIAFQNHGVAIILFTVGIKTLLLPFDYKAGTSNLENGRYSTADARNPKKI